MKCTVVWVLSAQDDLARIWIRAPDRQAVTAAAHRIDSALRLDADKQGDEFHGERVLVDPPLAVTFTVSPDDRLVTVLQVQEVTG